VGAAAEWQDVVKEALKAAVILAILERLHLTKPVSWLEVRRRALAWLASGSPP
jgi:hypothetical protein